MSKTKMKCFTCGKAKLDLGKNLKVKRNAEICRCHKE